MRGGHNPLLGQSGNENRTPVSDQSVPISDNSAPNSVDRSSLNAGNKASKIESENGVDDYPPLPSRNPNTIQSQLGQGIWGQQSAILASQQRQEAEIRNHLCGCSDNYAEMVDL